MELLKQLKFTSQSQVATPGAIEVANEHGGMDLIKNLLILHFSGYWGDCDEHDTAVNDEALKNGGRLMSVFKSDNHPTLWVITEWDRSVTTVLLPEEY